MPILEKAIPTFTKAIFSIDTTKFEVAQKAIEAGATIVNDVSGLQNEPRLAELCASHNATYILMHTQGILKPCKKIQHIRM